jgi:hypothetical protein
LRGTPDGEAQVYGEVVRPTDQERIADALAEIKDGLSRIEDPSVWRGYPDGWSPGDEGDEDDRGTPVGLFLNLERCTRGNPTWQMAMAIEIAFALGRTSEDKLSTDELARLVEINQAKWRTALASENGKKGGDAVRQGADDRWRAKGKEKWLAARGSFTEDDPRCMSQGIVMDIIELEVSGAPGRETVHKEIKKWDKELRTKGFWRPAWKPKRTARSTIGAMGA